MAKKEEHKEPKTEEVVTEEVEQFPESEFISDDIVGPEYNKQMMILDETTNKLIDKIDTLDPNDKKNWDDLKELSKILKNITSAKKNILKADLLGIELDDCRLYDDNMEEDTEQSDEEPIEFEDEEIEEVEEPEAKKDSKKHK